MHQQNQQQDHIERQQLIERVLIEGLEGQPQEALVDVVEVDQQDDHFPHEPELDEEFAVEEVGVVGVGTYWALGELVVD